MAGYQFTQKTLEAFQEFEKDHRAQGFFSKICGIAGNPALIYGKLQAFFGKSPYETEDFEDQYTYYISTRNSEGKPLFLYAYSGSFGPSVGGMGDVESLEAAKALVEMLQQIPPVDYDYEGSYNDGPYKIKISMGIQDGIPYFNEENMLSEEEELLSILAELEIPCHEIAATVNDCFCDRRVREKLIAALEQAAEERENFGDEFEVLCQRALELLRQID